MTTLIPADVREASAWSRGDVIISKLGAGSGVKLAATLCGCEDWVVRGQRQPWAMWKCM